MRFDLTDLKLFLDIVEAGSITGGAERAHMALAAASARVRGMEEELGQPLLDRGWRGIQPTASGWTLANHAKVVLHKVADMHGALNEYAHGLKAQIRLLCNTAALTQFLPEVLGPYLALNPHIDIELQECTSTEIIQLISSDKADAGIVSDSADVRQLESRPFQIDQLVAVVPHLHPLAGREAIAYCETLEYSFAGLMRGSALQDHLDEQAERLGTRLNYRIRLHDFVAVCRVVEEKAGIAIISETSAVRCSQTMAIKVVPLTDSWARRQLLACMKSFANLPSPIRSLLDAICP